MQAFFIKRFSLTTKGHKSRKQPLTEQEIKRAGDRYLTEENHKTEQQKFKIKKCKVTIKINVQKPKTTLNNSPTGAKRLSFFKVLI